MLPQILMGLLSNPLGLVAAATPFIVSHINNEKARIAAQAEHRAGELKRANDVFTTLSDKMDKLTYLSKQAMYGIVYRKLNYLSGSDVLNEAGTSPVQPLDEVDKLDVATFKQYSDELMSWECSINTNRAQVLMCFGEESGKLFMEIQSEFEKLANYINAAYWKKTTSQWFIQDNKGVGDTDFHNRYLPVWNKLVGDVTGMENVMGDITVLTGQMLYAIQHETVGSLRHVEIERPQQQLAENVVPPNVVPPENVAPPSVVPPQNAAPSPESLVPENAVP